MSAKKRLLDMQADMSRAEIVLRIPYRSEGLIYSYDIEPEVREVAIPLKSFINQVLQNVEGTVFGREDGLSLRLSYSPYWYFDGVPDRIEVEREVPE